MIFLLIFGALALYVMTSEERRRLLQTAGTAALEAMYWAGRHRIDDGPFGEALRARTPWLIVTPAIVVANLAIVVCVVFAEGAAGDQQTLIAWGASFGPRTSNGEWWRLATATFVHGSVLAVLINTVAIAQLGFVLERLIGHAAFAALYAAAGVLANVMALSASPETVTAGASGAVFGLYGLLLASIVRGMLQRSSLTIPFKALAVLAPVAAAFAIYGAVVSGFDLPARAGIFTGFMFGILVERGIREHKPLAQRLAVVSGATLMIATLIVVPLRGVTDIRPELALLIAVEERTAAAYDSAVLRFRNGRITTKALAQLIDGTILPELQAARARMTALQRVPVAHQALVSAANDYLKLRDESWRLRAQALNSTNMRLLREADRTERASLTVFEQIRQSPLESASQ
jgi:membrane associated rhomboid family serine protease